MTIKYEITRTTTTTCIIEAKNDEEMKSFHSEGIVDDHLSSLDECFNYVYKVNGKKINMGALN